MSRVLPRRPAWRHVAAAMLLLVAGACRSWQGQPSPTPGAEAQRLDGRVRVTRLDGSQVELADPRLESDTLRGERWRIGRGGERLPVSVPVDSVQRLEARRVSAGRTIALVGGVLAAYVGLALLVAAVAVVDY